jgi:hypothetical protein
LRHEASKRIDPRQNLVRKQRPRSLKIGVALGAIAFAERQSLLRPVAILRPFACHSLFSLTHRHDPSINVFDA